ncbi:MAG TPA: ACP phosphodiesterase [Hanamia sp.]|nr:ACP phosphodiesterase [Hanamia sp.]
MAHALLSFGDEDFLTGNMISDFVKGKRKFDYPVSIQKGIQLHRAIDEFTDFHPVTAEAKELFRPHYRLYAGPFVDIIYDHFLAVDDNQYLKNNGLKNFTEATYDQLSKNASYFPLPFQKMYPYMQSQNWLYGYSFKEGIRKSFGGLVRRASYLNESEIAFTIFIENYDQLAKYYEQFFPELKEFAFTKMQELQAE